MFVSSEWLKASGAAYATGPSQMRYAHLRHYTASWREEGSGPPLILIHGLAGGMDLVSPLARRLARDFTVMTYHLRGEDDSFALRRRFGMSDLVDDLAEFIEWCGLERPAIAGVSFGGVLALEYAARHPSRLSALAVQGCGAFFQRSLLQRVASLVLARYPLPDDNPFVNQFFNLFFGRKQRPGPLFHFVTRSCWATDQAVMAHRFRMVERADLRPRLGRIRVPALVASAGRDLLVSDESLTALCGGLHDVEQVSFPQSGHLAFVTEPELVANSISGFLQRVEAGDAAA